MFEGAGSNPGDKTLEDRFFEHEVTPSVTHFSSLYRRFMMCSKSQVRFPQRLQTYLHNHLVYVSLFAALICRVKDWNAGSYDGFMLS